MNPSADEEIGSRLQRIREGMGLNQSQLIGRLRSAGLGWSQATISKVEAGARPVRVAELPALAAALSVSQQDLLAPEDPIKSTLDRILLVEATAHESFSRLEERYLSARTARKGIQLLHELSSGAGGPFTVSCSSARFIHAGLHDQYSETELPVIEAFQAMGIPVDVPAIPPIADPADLALINEQLPRDHQLGLDWDQVSQLRESERTEEKDFVTELVRQRLVEAALGRAFEDRFPQVTFTSAADGATRKDIEVTGLEDRDA